MAPSSLARRRPAPKPKHSFDFSLLCTQLRAVFATALQGWTEHKLSWFDAHLWAYAEIFQLPEILSEDFSTGMRIGNVTVRNPFIK